MAASGTRSAVEKLSQQPVILLTSSSSSGGDSEDSDSDLSGDWEINPLPTKRQRMEVISGGSSPNSKLLSDGFLDPLPPPKPSKVSLMLSGKKDEHTKWNDTKICFLLKLLEDYNEPKWRHRVKWANGVWKRIFQGFKKRFQNANVSKSQLQDRAYKMKQTYKLLKKLSETSRLRWDHTSNMLQGPKNAWRTLMRTNKDAKQWYNKPWPYYSICQRLFEGKKDKHTKWNDTKKCFLLKLLEDYNEPKWRKQDKWVNGVWERICQDFKNRFPKANVSKTQLQDRAYQMKKTYKILKKLSEMSCLRWDSTSNMLEGSENAWRALMRTNKAAKQWYNKPWPYYSICQRLFEGKSIVENQSTVLKDCKESEALFQSVKTSQQFVELQEIDEVSEPQMHPWSDLDDTCCQISSQKKYKSSQMPSIGKSDVDNQSSGLNDCKENVTTPLHVKTSQQFVELQDIEEAVVHFGSDLDDPPCQISSQKEDGTFQVTSGSFTTSTGKPSSNLKLTREFTDMRSESEFSIKICLEAFYKLDGFTREDVLKVGRIFKIMENREMFMSLRDDDKELWLRGEMDACQF